MGVFPSHPSQKDWDLKISYSVAPFQQSSTCFSEDSPDVTMDQYDILHLPRDLPSRQIDIIYSSFLQRWLGCGVSPTHWISLEY